MDNILIEIADLIQAAGIRTVGTDLFVGHEPPQPDNLISLTSGGGYAQEMYLDTNYQTIDVWARNVRTETAYDDLTRVFSTLHRLGNVSLGSGRFYLYFLHATSHVLDMDRDNQGRKLFKITFQAIYRDTNIIS